MIKNLSAALAISVCVTACGGSGGGGGNKPASSAPASSAPMSSAPASSVAPSSKPASSVAPSSKPASSIPAASSTPASASSASSVDPSVIVIDVTQFWENHTAQVANTNLGKNVVFNAQWDGALYEIPAPLPVPMSLTIDGSTFEMMVDVSSEFKASGAGLGLFAYVDNDPWIDGYSKGDCPVVASENLVVGSQKITCKLDMGGLFNQKNTPFGIGIQAVNGTSGTTTYGTTVLLTDARILLADEDDIIYPSSSSSSSSSSTVSSAGPVVINLSADTWYGTNGATKNGTTFTFSGYQGIAYWLSPANAAIENATAEVDLNISSAFKSSGASLQLYVEIQAAPWAGKTDCGWLNNTDITPGVTQKISCVLNSGGVLTQTATAVEVKVLGVGGSTPSGAVTIEGGKITLPN